MPVRTSTRLFAFLVGFWAMGLITFAVYQTFADVTLIDAAVVSALAAVLGVPTGAAGIAALVQRRRKRVD